MKKILLIIFLGLNLTIFAQNYPFLSPSTKKIKEKEYITYLNDNIGKLDSIQKQRNGY